jgi:hypothetical protein
VEGAVARHTALPGITVARSLAGAVAALEGANQRRIAIRVDRAAGGQLGGPRGLTVRAGGRNEQTCDSKNERLE